MHEGHSRIEAGLFARQLAARIAAQTNKNHNAMQLVAKQASRPGKSGSKCFVCRELIARARTYICVHAILLNASKDTSWAELITHIKAL